MPEPKRPLKVFLCHASADKPAVRELYQRLKSEAWIDPWLDVARILPGQHWTTVIKQSLAEADSVIILISNNSINREGFVQREMNYAWEISLEKPRHVIYLIPLRLEDCDVPYDLRERQWADYFGEKLEGTYHALLESLKLRHEQKLKIEAEEIARQEEQRKIEKNAREKAEKETAEKARLEVEEQERQKIAKEKADRDAAEKAACEKAERETVEKARLEAEELARQKAEKEKAEREAAEKAARKKAEEEDVEKMRLEAEELTRQKIAKEKEERDAAGKTTREKEERPARDIFDQIAHYKEKELVERARLEAENWKNPKNDETYTKIKPWIAYGGAISIGLFFGILLMLVIVIPAVAKLFISSSSSSSSFPPALFLLIIFFFALAGVWHVLTRRRLAFFLSYTVWIFLAFWAGVIVNKGFPSLTDLLSGFLFFGFWGLFIAFFLLGISVAKKLFYKILLYCVVCVVILFVVILGNNTLSDFFHIPLESVYSFLPYVVVYFLFCSFLGNWLRQVLKNRLPNLFAEIKSLVF